MTMRIAGWRSLPPSTERLSDNLRSLRRHALVGACVIAALVFGLAGAGVGAGMLIAGISPR